MGVLACDRRECTNIMCDCCIANHYVCNECIEEFKLHHEDTTELVNEGDLTKEFLAFMNTPKDPYLSNKLTTVDSFFKKGDMHNYD